MMVMEPGSEILKVDEVGRIQTPPEKREALLVEYDRSGMTGARFARFYGVRYATLMCWLQRRRKEAGRGQQVRTPGPDHPRWLEARSPCRANSTASRNRSPDGIRQLVAGQVELLTAQVGKHLKRMGFSAFN
jgi:transposase